ncbi:hypothetical protein [Burkholderia sp. MS455]|uniref:hypothetical protein n=1 Tax=Burkholderia sp. MS455 TaxID=2811788 RepID=UPI001957FAB8|nr:hypothetical protein [Burkholderia sp. MS455]
MRFANGVLAVSVVVLAGCVGCPKPVTIDRPVEVRVPVAVPCVTSLPAKPAFKTDAQLKAGSNYQIFNDLLADRLAREIYESQLEAELAGCVQTVGVSPQGHAN